MLRDIKNNYSVEEYEANKEFYNAWNSVHTATMAADGVAGGAVLGKSVATGIAKIGSWDNFLAIAKRNANSLKGEFAEAWKTIKGLKARDFIDLVKAEERYAKTYVSSSSKPYGLQMTLDEVEKLYGVNGRKIVEETQRKAKELLSDPNRIVPGDPVLTGLIDDKTGQVFFGQNLKSQRDIDLFLENLHPILKKRLEVHQSHITNKTLNAAAIDIQRAGVPASHSEIVAIDEALKAKGTNVKEADLNDFIIHNKRLGGEVDNLGIPKGCPPRCVHCWFLSDDIRVIGND